MRYFTSALAALSLFAVADSALAQAPRDLALTSPAFADGSVIPDKFTQQGSSFVSPQLDWTDVPAGTQSFVLWEMDPDTALNRSTTQVLHWLAFNIPGTAKGLKEGVPNVPQLADGTIQPKNTRGDSGYLGSGAPHTVYHHSTFQLYALDTKLGLDASATLPEVLAAMNTHILAKAVLVGRFHKH